ncbi:response regulator [candidate division KSB1 bacterium]
MMHILITDNFEPTRFLVKDLLESMDDFTFTISETGNGQEAWEIIEAQKPDLIISGNTMPGMSGFELAKKVKAEYSPYRDTPFMFCSGAPGPYNQEISNLGAVNLPKPYSVDDFLGLVRTLLS